MLILSFGSSRLAPPCRGIPALTRLPSPRENCPSEDPQPLSRLRHSSNGGELSGNQGVAGVAHQPVSQPKNHSHRVTVRESCLELPNLIIRIIQSPLHRSREVVGIVNRDPRSPQEWLSLRAS